MDGLIEVPKDYKSGYVALIGRPNVGKSTLLNALIGRKLSIVTHKAQTTRHRVLGILSEPAYQLILLDTPGILKPKYKMHEAMMRNVNQAIDDADVLLLMADATRDSPDEFALSHLKGRPTLLLLNKIDLIDPKKALPLAQAYQEAHPFEAVLPISALKNRGVDKILDLVLEHIPLGYPFYPPDMVSEHPERFFVAEIIREQIFLGFREEIPFSTAVNIIAYEERSDKKDLINAEIVVERDSQKGILIGKGGSALKRIGTKARKEIEAFTERGVFLQLHVKVRPNWRNRDNLLQSYGY